MTRSVTRGWLGGESSVYYTCDGGVSSSLATLAKQVGAGVDLPAMARWISSLEEPSTRTVFSGVHRLLPGETLVVDGARRTLTTAPCRGAAEQHLDDVETCAALLRGHVERVVNAALEGSACAGIMVGGLDSCGLAAIAIQQGRVPIKLVTLDYGGKDPDRPYVEELARRYSAELITCELGDGEALVESLLLVDGAPYGSAGSITELLAARALRSAGADRVLTGFFGDDAFGGEREMIGTRVFLRNPLLGSKLALGMRIPDSATPWQRAMDLILRPILREALPRRVRERRRRAHLAAHFAWTTRAFLDLLEDSAWQMRRYRMPRTNDELFALHATSMQLMDAVDARTQIRALTGLPRIDPYLDVELVRFTSSLPFETLNCDGLYRGLFRRALADALPSSTRTRTGKADPEDQIVEIVKRQLSSRRMRELSTVPCLAGLGWVDPKLLRAHLDDLHTSDELNALWPFLAAEALLQACS